MRTRSRRDDQDQRFSFSGRVFGSRLGRRRRLRGSRRGEFESLEARQVLTGLPVISEVLASNDRIIEDQDGDDSDFVEIFNAGDSDLSLNRYYLTDDSEDLQKWRFPDITLGVGDYLVVFASGKDRNDPANELHTNFRISAGGEYLALVEPDGSTVAFEYGSKLPQQVTDVSYGIPTGIRDSVLIASGAPARVMIPTDGSLDPAEPNTIAGSWLDPSFDDSGDGWIDANTGIGYVPPNVPVILADSVADFSGVQGQDNWHYGTWAKNFDSDGVYAPSDFAPLAADRYFLPELNKWDVGLNGTAPSTEITPTGGHPASGRVGFFTHWAVRRWISETEGEITIRGTLANPDATGDGVVGRILVNGTEVFQQAVNGTSTEYSITTTVALGDIVDFAIDLGDAEDETGDTTEFTAEIQGVPIRELPVVLAADSSDDWERTDQQGVNNWYYGYYDASADADGSYASDDLRLFTAVEWNRSRWQWPDDSSELEISSSAQEAYADANLVQWPIRRWSSPVSGVVEIEYDVAKLTSGGDGLTARLFHNGVEIDSVQIEGADRTGTTRTVTIEGIAEGDLIDLAIDPLGIGGDPGQPDGDSDRASVDIRISRVADLGYEINSDIRSAMQGIGSTAYIRIPFNVDDVGRLDELTLNVKYDDAFVAFINGQEVASGNISGAVGWNTVASSVRMAEDATLNERFDLTDDRGLFVQGENVLQILAINSDVTDDDLLIVPELIVGTLTADLDQARYFASPSPGLPNGLGAARVGPLVAVAESSPSTPTEADPIVVSATVAETFNGVAEVELTYVVMYGDPVVIPMADDGQGNDAVAGDGIYTAVIPGNIAGPGQMVRWFVTARDTQGLSGRLPIFDDPDNKEQYLGTMIADTSFETQLPTFHLFVEAWNRATTTGGTSGSIYYDGEFYDNVHFALHGQSSQGFPTQKKSLNVDFANDHRLRLRDDLRRMEDINLLTNFADKAKVRNTLGYEQRAFTGGAHHLAFPIRVHNNGEFFAVYDFVEDPDERWLERLGFDTSGSLYKIYDTFTSAGGAEKKAGDEPGNDDLADVIAGVRQRNDADTPYDDAVAYIMDNVNLARMANYLAGFVLTSNRDCCHKNYYAFNDGERGEWWFLPWDVDLSQGRNWVSQFSYYDDTITYSNPLFMGGNNTLIQRLYSSVPGFRDMYLRRVRTLIDEYVKPPGTPRDQLPLETRVDELVELMKPDAELDNQRNRATWGQTGFQSFDEAITILLEEYSKQRREWLYTTQVVPDDGDIPVLLSGEVGAATGTYFIPTDESLGRTWTTLDFDDSSWESGPLGIGFELSNDNYTDLMATDLGQALEGKTSLYVRVPFQVDDPSSISQLSLRMKYEDGYVAYINGVEVSRQGLRQDEPTFDSNSRARSTRFAQEFENVVITDFIDQLVPGENVLAIHALNSSATSDDMFVLPELIEGIVSNASGEVPKAQRGNPRIDFGSFDYNPTSGNQNEEYIALVNNNSESVDITGWHLSGDVEHTFEPGTVLPAGYTLYVAADARSFRARAEGPSGSQLLFVQGNYDNRLPNVGGSVQLVAADGTVVNQLDYEGTVDKLQDFLRISEVMYNPMEASAAELASDNSLISDDFEFIELVNVSPTETLNLTGVQLTNGVNFDFTAAAITELAPNDRVVVARNLAAFTIRYGEEAASRVAGEFANNTALRDSGELVTLTTADGSIIANFEYSDVGHQGWPELADGEGSSLVVIDVLGDYNEPTNWRASVEVHGSPGESELASAASVVINEVLSRPVGNETDRIELYNSTNQSISLAGYYLSDAASDLDSLSKFALPNVTLAPQAYLVLTEADFNANGDPNGFGLSSLNGDQLYLTQSTGGTLRFVDAVRFDASAAGESFGRSVVANGGVYPTVTPTFGAANSGPRVGPLVISEVMYNPGQPSAAARAVAPGLTPDDLEFIEIYNPTAEVVDLSDWRIRLGIDMEFDAGTQIGAGQTLVLLSFNPANEANAERLAGFRTHYGIDDSVAVAGGYGGQLSNQGEGVRLVRPGQPPADDPTVTPRLLEDEVLYDTLPPWTSAVTQSLTRVSADAYGNEASSWLVTDASPGAFSVERLGDLTGDGRVDQADVEALHTAGRTNDLAGDFTGNGIVDQEDMAFLIEDIMGTSIGDVNFDGVFNSTDLVELFIIGQFNDAVVDNSTYVTGDWNLDGEFNTDDLLFALQRGGYSTDGAAAANAAPLPAVAAAVLSQTQTQELSDTSHDLFRSHLLETETIGPQPKRVLLGPAPYDAVFAEFETFEFADDEANADDWF